MAFKSPFVRFSQLSIIYAPYIPLIVSSPWVDTPAEGEAAKGSVFSFGIANIDISRFPHKCPRCKSAAYVGLITVECSRKGCK